MNQFAQIIYGQLVYNTIRNKILCGVLKVKLDN